MRVKWVSGWTGVIPKGLLWETEANVVAKHVLTVGYRAVGLAGLVNSLMWRGGVHASFRLQYVLRLKDTRRDDW